MKRLILIKLLFSIVLYSFGQEVQPIIRFEGIKTWEQDKSPTDLVYKVVPNWLKIPMELKPKAVSSVTVDSKGVIYIVDRDSVPAVTAFNDEGAFLFQWKPKGLGTPHFIHADPNDDLWITDTKNHQIYKLSKKGEIIFTLGEKGINGKGTSHFDKPTDIDFLKDGSILVSDGYGQNKRILKYNSKFEFIEEWGSKGTAPGQFAIPHALLVGSDNKVYVADRDAWRVQVFDDNGKLLEVWPHIGRVFDIVESSDHHFFCFDATTARITEVDSQGKVLGFFGDGSQLIQGHGLTITSKGFLLAALLNGTVVVFSK